jgi:sporulation protein YlmC with PRC-barrel domain
MQMKKFLPALSGALLLATIAAGPASAVQDNTQMMTSVPNDAMTISTYYNEDVYDNQENKIGDVNDILLDANGRVSAVIVGVGGFLGVGEKDVAVPFNALKVAEKNGDRYLVMNTSKEALQSAPGYTFDKTKGVWTPATKQPS